MTYLLFCAILRSQAAVPMCYGFDICKGLKHKCSFAHNINVVPEKTPHIT